MSEALDVLLGLQVGVTRAGRHDGANRVERTGEEDDRGEAEQRDDERGDRARHRAPPGLLIVAAGRARVTSAATAGAAKATIRSQPLPPGSPSASDVPLLERDRGECRHSGDQPAAHSGGERRAAEARAARGQRQEHHREEREHDREDRAPVRAVRLEEAVAVAGDQRDQVARDHEVAARAHRPRGAIRPHGAEISGAAAEPREQRQHQQRAGWSGR